MQLTHRGSCPEASPDWGQTDRLDVEAPATLAAYPWVIVRLCCDTCGRKGGYRLARLGARCGPERPLLEVLAGLSADCPARDRRAPIKPRGGRMDAQLDLLPLDPFSPRPTSRPERAGLG
jgi:hypothetical protein